MEYKDYKNTYCNNTENNIERYHKAGWTYIDKLNNGTVSVKACMVLGREVCFLTDDPINAVKINDTDEEIDPRKTFENITLDRIKVIEAIKPTKSYYSKKGYTLLYEGPTLDKPILTVDSTSKWTTLYLIDTDGSVYEKANDNMEWIDDCPTPYKVYDYAVENGFYIHKMSMVLIMGKMIFDYPDTGSINHMYDFPDKSNIYI